jgi:hypothetical protein
MGSNNVQKPGSFFMGQELCLHYKINGIKKFTGIICLLPESYTAHEYTVRPEWSPCYSTLIRCDPSDGTEKRLIYSEPQSMIKDVKIIQLSLA